MRKVFKNRYGLVRSGWIVFICMALFYALTGMASMLSVEILRKILIATGDINDTTGYMSSLALAIGDALPVALQILMEIVIILLSISVWKIMRYQWRDLGLRDFSKSFKKDGITGLLLGFGACTMIFLILIFTDNVRIDSVRPDSYSSLFWWIVALLLVGFGEELFCRGLLMSVLRRSNNIYLIMALPSVIFAGIHLFNPGVTAISIVNIILIGIVFSYSYYKSGNLWMCIGYHITWNIFQSVIYGMPVSGLNISSIMTSHYPAANLLNGGDFGIEGGILTTCVNVLLFLYLLYRYRTSTYEFLPDPHINFKGTSDTRKDY